MKTIEINKGWGTGHLADYQQVDVKEYQKIWRDNIQTSRLVFLIEGEENRKIAQEKAEQIKSLIDEISEMAFEDAYQRESKEVK
jgi:phosphoribosyl-dephospho-CoA transferase|tara:strand:+ start:287 stop:538 length:252 start_codon:yes stop_codon:yes gene_type:complete